jgi:8-oxo-dGTP pyrophosphatase MutT (NUDIX family)
MKKYAGIIVRCNNQVLLCKRNNEGTLPGYWSCPGGKMETGETAKETAIREFMEETDLPIYGDLRFVAAIKRYTRDGTTVKGLMHCYLLDVDEEIYPDLDRAIDGDEHTKCGYFSKNNLPKPMTKQFEKIINMILK